MRAYKREASGLSTSPGIGTALELGQDSSKPCLLLLHLHCRPINAKASTQVSTAKTSTTTTTTNITGTQRFRRERLLKDVVVCLQDKIVGRSTVHERTTQKLTLGMHTHASIKTAPSLTSSETQIIGESDIKLPVDGSDDIFLGEAVDMGECCLSASRVQVF